MPTALWERWRGRGTIGVPACHLHSPLPAVHVTPTSSLPLWSGWVATSYHSYRSAHVTRRQLISLAKMFASVLHVYCDEFYICVTCVLWRILSVLNVYCDEFYVCFKCVLWRILSVLNVYYDECYVCFKYLLWWVLCLCYMCTVTNFFPVLHVYCDEFYICVTCVLWRILCLCYMCTVTRFMSVTRVLWRIVSVLNVYGDEFYVCFKLCCDEFYACVTCVLWRILYLCYMCTVTNFISVLHVYCDEFYVLRVYCDELDAIADWIREALHRVSSRGTRFGCQPLHWLKDCFFLPQPLLVDS